MKIVGCDLHTRYQQIAMLEQETGELIERRLEHESGEARAFYAALSAPVRVGIDAGCPSIREKALSRQKCPVRCRSTACFAREVEDQDSGNLTRITFGGRSFHQPSMRPEPRP